MGQSKQHFDRSILVDLEIHCDGEVPWCIRFPVSRHLKGFDLGKTIESAAGCIVGLLNNPGNQEALNMLSALFNDKQYLSQVIDIGHQLNEKEWFGQVDATNLLPSSYGDNRVMRFFSNLAQCQEIEGNVATPTSIGTYVAILKQTSKSLD